MKPISLSLSPSLYSLPNTHLLKRGSVFLTATLAHKVLDASQRTPSGPSSLTMPPPQSSFGPVSGPGGFEGGLNSPATVASPTTQNYSQNASSLSMMPNAQRPIGQTQHERSFSYGSVQNAPAPNQQFPGRNSYQQPQAPQQSPPSSQPQPPPMQQPQAPGPRFNGSMGSSSLASQGPPQLGALPFQTPAPQPGPLTSQPTSMAYSPPNQSGPGPQQPHQNQQQRQQRPQELHAQSVKSMRPAQGQNQGQGRGPSPPSAPTTAPTRPVFGISLQKLYERDQLAVPMVIYQCIQAVDLYGLSVEGIYRLSGSLPSVNKLKQMFDTGT
jgi:hypothetical protein